MDIKLIDRAWACLPREFKEKVKKKYARCVKIDADDNPHLPAYAVKSAISRKALLEKLFGIHNLTAAEQSMTDSETEHTKDKFVARMRGKFTEQDFTEAKQRTESCMASIPQFELPKQIEAQIDEAMGSIKAEARRQYGNFGAANADIAILVHRQMMRLGALLALSAGDLESEQTDSDRGDYISMTKPTDPNK